MHGFSERMFCAFPVLCTNIFGGPYSKALCADFSPHLGFLIIVGNGLRLVFCFFLGRQPSSPTVVHFPEQAGILPSSSQEESNSHQMPVLSWI